MDGTRRPITIYRVAERAGVSISTVSNVLNKPERVSPQTRARVLEIAHELGFVPKSEAVSLARRGTGRIGVMAPFTSYHSYLRRLSGVLDSARDHGMDVLVFDLESAALAASPTLASMPAQGRLDGLIVMGLPIEASIEQRLFERGLPTVAVDAQSSRFSRVLTDDVEGGRLGAQHLLEKGHRRLGYLLERQVSDYESQAVKRLVGFRAAVREAQLPDAVVEISDNSLEGARYAGLRLLDRADPPTAVMAHHDLLALGVIRAAREMSLRVPEDLAVVGFDDGETAVAADLTTVHQPFEESGRLAMTLLQRHISGQHVRSTTLLELHLIERSTT